MTAFHPDWIEGVSETLQKRSLLQRGARIVVAVSGGLDSMVLLHVLHSMAANNEWKLLVAHFNHQLRGRASEADERLVVKTAMELSLPVVQGRGDVAELQKRLGISLEMAARKLRHEFLTETAIHFSEVGEITPPSKVLNSVKRVNKPKDELLEKQMPAVALAHHADDQSELFFLRLFRGAGGEGMAGMRWSNPSPANQAVRLIRPLLNQTKSALMAYARHEGVPYREDATNKKTDILRNRIRHRLLPIIRNEFQADVDAKISRFMETVGSEADFVKLEAKKWLDQKKRPHFEQLAVAMQRQVIRLQLRFAGVETDFECVEHLRTNPDQPISIARDLTAKRDVAGRIVVTAVRSLAFQQGQTRLVFSDHSGQADIGGLMIEWQILTGKALTELKKDLIVDREKRRKVSEHQAQTNKTSVGCEYFDADAIGRCALLRHWRAGDRFQPIGMAQSAKVQDILTNLKFPAADRRSIVVGEAEGGKLFWVQGLRMSEEFKIGRLTERCLRWIWHPLDGK